MTTHKRMTSLTDWVGRFVFLVAALASLATSKTGSPAWTYREHLEPVPFFLDATTPFREFDILLAPNDRLSDMSTGDLKVDIALDDDVGAVQAMFGDEGDYLFATVDSENSTAVLSQAWPDFCDVEGCVLRLKLRLTDGESATGTFELTAVANGPWAYGDDIGGPPPSGAKIDIVVAER